MKNVIIKILFTPDIGKSGKTFTLYRLLQNEMEFRTNRKVSQKYIYINIPETM
jgi:hypothetical protein